MKRNRIIAALAAGTIIAGAAYVWNDKVSAPAVAAIPTPPPAVMVAAPEYRPVAEWDTYAARFAATDEVEVSSRISGHRPAQKPVWGHGQTTSVLLFSLLC